MTPLRWRHKQRFARWAHLGARLRRRPAHRARRGAGHRARQPRGSERDPRRGGGRRVPRRRRVAARARPARRGGDRGLPGDGPGPGGVRRSRRLRRRVDLARRLRGGTRSAAADDPRAVGATGADPWADSTSIVFTDRSRRSRRRRARGRPGATVVAQPGGHRLGAERRRPPGRRRPGRPRRAAGPTGSPARLAARRARARPPRRRHAVRGARRYPVARPAARSAPPPPRRRAGAAVATSARSRRRKPADPAGRPAATGSRARCRHARTRRPAPRGCEVTTAAGPARSTRGGPAADDPRPGRRPDGGPTAVADPSRQARRPAPRVGDDDARLDGWSTPWPPASPTSSPWPPTASASRCDVTTPMVDDLQLAAVQWLRQETQQGFVEQRVAGLDGAVHQKVGRRSHRVLVSGCCSRTRGRRPGDAAGQGVERRRGRRSRPTSSPPSRWTRWWSSRSPPNRCPAAPASTPTRSCSPRARRCPRRPR